jgi:hypothetical protein
MRRDLATSYPRTFAGAITETPEALERLKERLGVQLPADFVWFVTALGSGSSGAFSGISMAEESTLRFRRAIALPSQYIVLDDRNDAGAILLYTDGGSVLWVDAHALVKIGSNTMSTSEYESFPNLESWIVDCAEEIENEL